MENNSNRPPEENNQDQDKQKKRHSGTAASIDGIINSPTEAARSHRHTDQWSSQGTNISYEGATAPGGGGSVGTGYASGQDAVGARVSADDESDFAVHEHTKDTTSENKDIDEDLTRPEDRQSKNEDTIGNP
ncbi:MAG TPA: hypothetical protein VL093_08040 [Flavipsychrobacter sp.]|nr:hypothetical protein [Flavipsychrobacter sp.]